jgi:HEAT repeat protein
MRKSAVNSRQKVLRTFHAVLDRDNALSRCCGVRALEKLNACDKKSKRGLIDLLRDPDPDVRMDAASTLGRMHVVEAMESLIGNLENDPDGDVRIEAVKALSQMGSKKAVAPLIRCFKADGYPELDQMVDDVEYGACWEVQAQALNALGEIGDQRATAPVMEALEDEEYEDLQESGFRVLAQLNNDKTKHFLLTQLREGGRLARRRAAQAMTALPGLRGKSGHLARELLTALTDALVDKDASVRAYAAHALGKSGDAMAVVPLTLLLNDPDLEVRKEVATLLGKMRGAEVVDRLHPLLDHGDSRLKRQIVRVLGDIGDPASLAPLSALLDTEDQDLLYEVVEALGEIGVLGPQEELARILTNKKTHANVRTKAAWALGRILGNAAATHKQTKQAKKRKTSKRSRQELKQPSVEEIITASIFDEDERVGYAALSALVAMDPVKAVGRLVSLVRGNVRAEQEEPDKAHADHHRGKDAHTWERPAQEIPEELKDMLAGHDAQTSTLASIFSRQAEDVEPAAVATEAPLQRARAKSAQIRAARLLGDVPNPGPRAIKALKEAFEAGENGLHEEALTALGRIGDKRALPTMMKALGAESAEIRLAALDALAHFKNVSGVDKPLARLCQDPDPNIRLRAVKALSTAKGQQATEVLCRALEDENLDVCRVALAALSKQTYTQECADRVAGLIFRFSGELRQEAAATLRRLKDFSAAPWLLDTLNDQEQEEFHWMCIDALAEMYADKAMTVTQRGRQ